MNTPSCQQTLSYDVTETTFYITLDSISTHDLTSLEQVKLRENRTVKHYEYCQTADGEVSIDVTLMNPEEVYEPWEEQVVRTVVTRDDVRQFNTQGAEISIRTKSERSGATYLTFKQNVSEFGFGIGEGLQNIPDYEILELQNQGYLVQQSEGQTTISNENVYMLHDPVNGVLVVQQFENGQAIKTDIKKYGENSSGEAVPVSWMKKERLSLNSGVCVERIQLLEYSNFEIGSGLPGNIEGSSSSENKMQFGSHDNGVLRIAPNPNAGFFIVNVPDFHNEAGDVSIIVVNSIGETVWEENGLHSGDVVNVDLSVRPNGIYTVRAVSNGKSKSVRFSIQ